MSQSRKDNKMPLFYHKQAEWRGQIISVRSESHLVPGTKTLLWRTRHLLLLHFGSVSSFFTLVGFQITTPLSHSSIISYPSVQEMGSRRVSTKEVEWGAERGTNLRRVNLSKKLLQAAWECEYKLPVAYSALSLALISSPQRPYVMRSSTPANEILQTFHKVHPSYPAAWSLEMKSLLRKVNSTRRTWLHILTPAPAARQTTRPLLLLSSSSLGSKAFESFRHSGIKKSPWKRACAKALSDVGDVCHHRLFNARVDQFNGRVWSNLCSRLRLRGDNAQQ